MGRGLKWFGRTMDTLDGCEDEEGQEETEQENMTMQSMQGRIEWVRTSKAIIHTDATQLVCFQNGVFSTFSMKE